MGVDSGHRFRQTLDHSKATELGENPKNPSNWMKKTICRQETDHPQNDKRNRFNLILQSCSYDMQLISARALVIFFKTWPLGTCPSLLITSHRQDGGTLGMVPLIINPIYTHLLGKSVYPLKKRAPTQGVKQLAAKAIPTNPHHFPFSF